MAETMLLIAGRSSKQGTSLNAGKHSAEYIAVTTTLEMNSDDMARLGMKDGDQVQVRSPYGAVVLRCKARKPEDLPSGLLFVAYGPPSSELMGSDTHGSGMPDSKDFEVEIEPVAGGANDQ